MRKPIYPVPQDDWQSALVKELEEHFNELQGLDDKIEVLTNDRGNIKAEIVDDLTIILTDTMGYIRKLEGFQLTLEGELNTVRSKVLEETELKVTEFEGIARKILTLETSLTNTNTKIEARVAEESLARVNSDGALARHIVGVQAEALTAASDAYAAAHAELVAFAGPYASMAAYNIDVTAAYKGYADTVAGTAQTNAEATASSALTTFASGHGSLASFQTTLTTTYNGVYATITNLNSLDNTVDGVLLKHGVVGTINGVTGGFIFTGIQKLDGSVTYDLEIDSNVTINGNLIVNGTITSSELAANSATKLFAETDGDDADINTNDTICSINCDLTVGDVLVLVDIGVLLKSGDTTLDATWKITLEIFVDGSGTGHERIWQIPTFRIEDADFRAESRYPLTMMRRINGLTPGTRTISVKCTQSSYDAAQFEVFDPTICVFESRR